MNSSDLSLIGLCADVVGAVILARGFMQKRVVEAWRESQPRLGSNSFQLKSALLQKSEAWVGAGFLVAGFLLQMAGTMRLSAEGAVWLMTWQRVATALAGMAALGWTGAQLGRTFAQRRFYRVFLRRWKEGTQLQRRPDDPDWLSGMCYLYDLKPRKAEGDEALFVRLQARVEEVAARYGGQERELP